jgi:predicted O-methyltransferase YrrM
MIEVNKDRIEQIIKISKSIQGWCTEWGGILLYMLALNFTPNDTIVELGSWKGTSTVWLASAIKDKSNPQGRVYAVDTWEGSNNEEAHRELLKNYDKDQLYNEFLNNMEKAGFSEVIVPLRGDTVKISREWRIDLPIGILHIDASHEYEDVRRDFELWSPYVAKGGFIVFDDVPIWAGPSRLITELPKWYQFVYINGVSSNGPNKWVVVKL